MRPHDHRWLVRFGTYTPKKADGHLSTQTSHADRRRGAPEADICEPLVKYGQGVGSYLAPNIYAQLWIPCWAYRC